MKRSVLHFRVISRRSLRLPHHHNGTALRTPTAGIHEKPFLALPKDATKGAAYEAASNALLQLNLMIRRGIEPDAIMYTSLIHTMGKAGLEWQAYKLFSRMVEQDVRPIPETYVALLEATSKNRRALREQIKSKISETIDTFPEQLAKEEVARQKEEDRLCIAKFNEYMRGELPSASLGLAASDPPAPTEAREEGHGTGKKDEEGSRPVATMQIRNPTDVWSTAQMAEEVRAAPHAIASGEAAKSLREQLDKLDDEELRIYLAAQRQLRHGDREQLIQRVLTTVSETSIREMLERRHHYFRSVEQILANDLRQLHMQGAVAPSPVAREKDTTLTGAEEETAAPELLHAPWGILRRPRRRRADPPMDRNADRLTQLALTEEELLLVYHRASTKDLDELPESLLRRYAYQFRLRWRRKQPNSLLEAVQWHAVTFLSVTEEGRLLRTQPSPTPAVRLQQEDEGMQKTLENFEAFRIISQRTNNLQVVDNKEINLRLKQIRREATKQDSRLEQDLRRERNLMAAASLASSAMAYTPPPAEDEDPTSHVLGWQQQQQETPPQLEEMPSELPPWELFSGEEEFRLDTGHFGDPTTGHYRELSDSKIAVLPSQESQKQWGVDDHLLPARLQEVVQEALLEQKRRHESIEKEYQEKLNYKRYKKWDKFLQKAQDKQKGRQEEEGAVRPLPAQKRMAQLLRQGSHKQKVSDALRAKFNKEL